MRDDFAAAAPRNVIAGIVAGWLFLAGSALCVSAMLLPHSPEVDVAAIWIEAGVTALASVPFFVWARRLPRQVYPAAMLVATGVITVTMYFNGERLGAPSSGTEIYYVWVALYAGYFFSRAEIVFQLAAIAVLYAAILSIVHVGSVAPTRWLLTIAMVAGSATIVHVLKGRNDQLLRNLQAAARRDPLTGIANRQAFDERLAHELAVSKRTGRSTAVAFLDIDDFKQINDRFGHVCGDEVLRELATIACRSLRETDMVARLGGDEFAAILPGLNADGAFHVAERIRRAVPSAERSGTAPFTISVGVVDSIAAGILPEPVVRSADHALYRAKRDGRNRTARAEGIPIGAPAG